MGKKITKKSDMSSLQQQVGTDTLRRSTRQRKSIQDENYNWLMPADISPEEELYMNGSGGRKRKGFRNRMMEDSDDYEGSVRVSKKKVINPNKVASLLEWRDQVDDQQIRVMTDLYNDETAKCPPLSQEKISKNICNEKLQTIAQDTEAMFINIEWGKKGQTIEDFKKLGIDSPKLMTKGIVFIWVPKEHLSEIFSIMESKGFFYVENFEVINFDRSKAIREYCPHLLAAESKQQPQPHPQPALRQKKSLVTMAEEKASSSNSQGQGCDLSQILPYLEGVQPEDLIAQDKSSFFNCSKRTLIMFRKNSNYKLQLRHQRTCDVIFDMPHNPWGKCEEELKDYIYMMIETLLPESLLVEYRNDKELKLKLLELWGDKGTNRRGWINVVQQ